ncbi:MAG TPA: hypothetical protein VHD87_12925 [Acidimicrobiales bacterium]|nr:hypothetical protein [Acidimicrobiales bacterium]
MTPPDASPNTKEEPLCGYRFLVRSVDGDGYVECDLEADHPAPNGPRSHRPGRDVTYVENLDELERLIRERNGTGPFD